MSSMNRNNTHLQQRLKLLLHQQNRRRLRLLDVEVRSGVVCLRGPVKDFHERQLAISACRQIADVQEIVDEIEVEGPIIVIE